MIYEKAKIFFCYYKISLEIVKKDCSIDY